MSSLPFQPRPRPRAAYRPPRRPARDGVPSSRPRAATQRWWVPDPRLMNRLVCTEQGWALVTQSGDVVYRAEGPEARMQCLRRAYALGVQCMG